MTIPAVVRNVVEAARKLVAARRAFIAAEKSGELNERGLERLRKAMRAEIKHLDDAVIRLEAELARAKGRGGAPLPWASIFSAANSFLGLVTKVQAGDRSAVGDAVRFVNEHGPGGTRAPRRVEPDVIDGEFEEVK